MEDVAPVLAALKCATTVMSAETEVSIPNTYPITFSLINTHLMRVEGDSSKVAEFKSKVRTSLATMLDPQHKHLGFLTPTRRIPGNYKLLELAVAEDVSSTTDEASRTASGDERGTQAGVAVQGAALQRRTTPPPAPMTWKKKWTAF
ncbi:hypothetical protein SKAU_G00423190 [Synaphobranchus kaupii]|uniref:Uncharacterized protein n=1 Tax=Synaphobranchus kaupii TaxID=118154 RepID=A0A9Q1E5P0_SYNKA|nr:hypothetical protein SKAU_G00423190 [Synaphobranchus kaupii]